MSEPGWDKLVEKVIGQQSLQRGLEDPARFDRTLERLTRTYDRIVSGHLGAISKGAIVEVGCGRGLFLTYLLRKGIRALGVDQDMQNVTNCRDRGLQAIQADAIDWLQATKPGSLRTVIGIDFLEHLSRAQVLLFLDATAKALTEGGLLILRLPCGNSPFVGLNAYNDITHDVVLTEDALKVICDTFAMPIIEARDEWPSNVHGAVRPLLLMAGGALRFLIGKVIALALGHSYKFRGPTMWVVARRCSNISDGH